MGWATRSIRALSRASCCLMAFGLDALPTAQAAGPPRAAFALVGEPATAPFGWVDFCRRHDGECDGGKLAPLDINLTAGAIKELERLNQWVNGHIEPVADLDHWGVVDQWDYPTDRKGDCEDYAILKRRLLLEEGFPRQALLMTVVKDARNEGHALLTIKTNLGEFVLDNLNNEMKRWDQTGYRFVKRQSQSDQNLWVQIGEPTPAPEYVSR